LAEPAQLGGLAAALHRPCQLRPAVRDQVLGALRNNLIFVVVVVVMNVLGLALLLDRALRSRVFRAAASCP
jgi:ABC-type sugar transport system permease subunit